MSPSDPTFVFENDRAFAMVDGKVVAAADTIDELEEELEDKYDDGPKDDDKPKDEKSDSKEDKKDDKDLPAFLKKDDDKGEDDDDGDKEDKDEKKSGTYVTTPNGLKGKVLGKVKNIWGEELAVRFENGRIAHLRVSEDLAYSDEEVILEKPIEELRKKLEASWHGTDKPSFEARQAHLASVKVDARELILGGVSSKDEAALDAIRVEADHEIHELNDAIDHVDSNENEAFAPPAPFQPEVVEQESLGKGDGSWLDGTLNEMIEEANQYDYEKLMDEGPEEFAAGLDDGVVEDGGAVRQMASGYIRGKTAAADEDIRDSYEKTWLARVEACRRSESARRKEETREAAIQKKAAVDDGPDESLFM